MRLYLIRTESGELIPHSDVDARYIAKLGAGEILECDTRKARHPKHHRLFFALLQDAFTNQEKYRTISDLLVEIKLRAGWYDEHVTQDGKLVYVPQSISWARMDQEVFDKFYGEAIVALADMFPGSEAEAEADEILARAG